jgi:hypothetical protein
MLLMDIVVLAILYGGASILLLIGSDIAYLRERKARRFGGETHAL